MKKTMLMFNKCLVFILFFILVFSNLSLAKANDGVNKTAKNITLNVALYGYVPNPAQFKEVVSKRWKAAEPEVALNFVDWDCYMEDPGSNIDVFVFDAIYLTYFAEKGYLVPFSPDEIQNKDDIFSFALEGCKYKDVIYGIPQLGCTNLLFYRKGDAGLENVKGIKQLYEILGDNDPSQVPPLADKGLLIDLSSGTNCACNYLDTLTDVNRYYTDYGVLPDLNNLDEKAVSDMRAIVSMAGKEQSQYIPDPYDPYIRAAWFSQGSGRAYIGYTESMANMKDKISDIDFKMFSWAGPIDVPVFYSDVVGVNSQITDQNKKALAKEMANIIAAADTLEECIRPIDGGKYPQYLLPVRKSVYLRLKNDFTVYNKLYNMIIEREPNMYIFRMGTDARQWIDSAGIIIRQKLGLEP